MSSHVDLPPSPPQPSYVLIVCCTYPAEYLLCLPLLVFSHNVQWARHSLNVSQDPQPSTCPPSLLRAHLPGHLPAALPVCLSSFSVRQLSPAWSSPSPSPTSLILNIIHFCFDSTSSVCVCTWVPQLNPNRTMWPVWTQRTQATNVSKWRGMV